MKGHDRTAGTSALSSAQSSPARYKSRRWQVTIAAVCLSALGLPQASHVGAAACGAGGASDDSQNLSGGAENTPFASSDSGSPAPLDSSGPPASSATVDLLLDMVGSPASPGSLSHVTPDGTTASEPVKPLAARTGSTAGMGSGGCTLQFDLETGDSGDLDLEVRGGNSGDAFGGDARGGDSVAIGIGGSVALGGAGGPGGSAGGSGPYAGAVIGNFSNGGGGNGGNGGTATCIATGAGGAGGCTGGDVNIFGGGGGNAWGGKARSGDGGEAHAGDNSTGSTGDARVAQGSPSDPLMQIDLEP